MAVVNELPHVHSLSNGEYKNNSRFHARYVQARRYPLRLLRL